MLLRLSLLFISLSVVAQPIPPTVTSIDSDTNAFLVDTNVYVYVPISACLHSNVWTVNWGYVESNAAQSIVTVNITNSTPSQITQVQLEVPMLLKSPYKTNLLDTNWYWETAVWYCYRTDSISGTLSKFYKNDIKQTLLPP